MSKPTVVSLFSGIGGIDIAFEQAGFQIVQAIEFDRHCCITYHRNLTVPLVEADIRSVKNIPKADILAAGFPCQPFSIMGYQRSFQDPRGNLFFEIARLADEMKPSVILLENVKNLISHDRGRTFMTIHGTLAKLGYYIKFAILDASTHGNIPQERSRTFIAAFLDPEQMNKFAFPDEIPLTMGINDIIDRSVKHSDIYYYKPESRYYVQLDRKNPDKTGIYRIDDSGVANRRYTLSPTLKANMGTYHDRVPIIRDDFGIRKITPLECLALQGFPSDYTLGGVPLEAMYKQAGNSVCVPVVKRIADRLLMTFA